MKALLFYRPNSEHERAVLDYLREFTQRTGKVLQTVDVDSPDGTSLCRLYDIMQYPTIVATDNEGKLIQLWQGNPLPTISEVSYYAQD